MKVRRTIVLFRILAFVTGLSSTADFVRAIGVLYSDPGWTYAYDGNEAYYNDPDGPNPNYTRTSGPDDLNQPGGKSGTAALVFPGYSSPGVVDDAHAKWLNVSSQWDGTAPGATLGGVAGSPPPIPPAAPGGVGTFSDGSTSFLRLQDPGDPTSWGWADKGAQGAPGLPRQEGSNRKIEFAHPLSRDAGFSGNQTVLDSGITISLRTRIATAATGPIDGIYSQDGPAGSSVEPWPTNGVGYPIANGGRAPFDISDSGGPSGRQIGFGLVNDATVAQGSNALGKTGLVINNAATSTAGGSVDTFDATASTLNVVQVPNDQLTQWQEFWITIKKLPAAVTAATGNTHEVDVYYNGSLTPQVFQVVASTPNQDGGNGPALGLGVSSGTLWGGFDVDYFAYKEGVIVPTLTSGLPGDYNHDGAVNAADYVVWRDTLGSTSDLRADGNGDHTVNQADYSVWRSNFGGAAAAGQAAIEVPEPGSQILALGALVSIALFSPRRFKSHRWNGVLRNTSPLAPASIVAIFGVTPFVTQALAVEETQTAPELAAPQTIEVGRRRDVQRILDEAPEHSVILFNRNRQLVFSEPLRVDKPLNLRGLNAALPPKLGDSPLVRVTADGVTIEDFELHGNNDSVSQEKREALIFITGNDFRVEHGLVVNSSRHGVYAEPSKKTGILIGGVIRDIVGRGNARCVVGVGNDGNRGLRTKNIVIENIRCYDSSLRGAVNIKDGTENIIVRDVYSENSVYAVDVQDHHKPGEINRNITIENVDAVKCKYAVRSDNRPLGHENLTVRNVIAEQCAIPILISHTDHLVLENVRVFNQQIGEEPHPPISISNCNGVFARDITIGGSDYAGPALDIVNSDNVVIDSVTLQGDKEKLTSGVHYRVSDDHRHVGLRISNVAASQFADEGIVLDKEGTNATLVDYSIFGNLTHVSDRIRGLGAMITSNCGSPAPISTLPSANDNSVR